MASKDCVLVTGVGGRLVGHPILRAILTPAEQYRIADAEPFFYGLYQVPHRYVVPLASAPPLPTGHTGRRSKRKSRHHYARHVS